MARKTRADTEKTVTTILDAAESVFLAKGVANTTIADIAKRAEVSKGAVYGHYQDKIEVCVAVCRRGLRSLIEIPRPAFGQPHLTRLHQWSVSYLRLGELQPAFGKTMELLYCKCEKSPEFEPVHRVRVFIEKAAFHTAHRLLKRAATAGEIPASADLHLMNVYFQSLIDGIACTLWWTDRLNGTDPWPSVEKLLSAGIDTLRSSQAFR
ncbi:MAG: TetR family transcriptional regulator [Akkermansiaceae bacterium]|nr:TetR family transcriptional regulator [Akkermansiaceae bacterium]